MCLSSPVRCSDGVLEKVPNGHMTAVRLCALERWPIAHSSEFRENRRWEFFVVLFGLKFLRNTLQLALTVLTGLGSFGLGGCAHFHDQPLSAEKSGADFIARTLTDAGLRGYLEANRLTGEWPRSEWDFNSLALAAFYYQPSGRWQRREQSPLVNAPTRP